MDPQRDLSLYIAVKYDAFSQGICYIQESRLRTFPDLFQQFLGAYGSGHSRCIIPVVWVPTEEIVPFAAKKFLIVCFRPVVEGVVHFGRTGCVSQGGFRIVESAMRHAEACEQLVFIDHPGSSDRVFHQFEICCLQVLRDLLPESLRAQSYVFPTLQTFSDFRFRIFYEPYM